MLKHFFIKMTVVLSIATAHAQTVNTPTESIPFKLSNEDNRIYVQAAVNGSKPLKFLFDTGASHMVISTNSLKGVNIQFDATSTNRGATGVNTVKLSKSNTFTLGSKNYAGADFLGIEYSPDQWDGVIGLWFIKQQVTEINYKDRKIHLYKHGTYTPPANAIKLSISYVLGIPAVPAEVTVNGVTHKIKMFVDTGSDRVADLNSPFVTRHKLLNTQKPWFVCTITSSDGKTGTLHNVFFDKLKLGDIVLPKIPGGFSLVKNGVQSCAEVEGVMGNNLLKRFNLVFDHAKGFIYLIPNNLMYTPFYDYLILTPGL